MTERGLKGGSVDSPAIIVAMASSAGGLNALSAVLQGLPEDLPVAIVVVQHVDPRHKSLMPELLARRTTLRVKAAEDGELLATGSVYVAPPDRHLLVNPDLTVSLTRTELVHFLRPSADLLFESVAGAGGSRAIGVVLSGTGSDGAMGVRAIKKTGGLVIVQEPESAEFSGMPLAAIGTGLADYVLTLDKIGEAITDLVREKRP